MLSGRIQGLRSVNGELQDVHAARRNKRKSIKRLSLCQENADWEKGMIAMYKQEYKDLGMRSCTRFCGEATNISNRRELAGRKIDEK